MRIFYAAGSSPNAYHISESQLWKYNLYDSLVDLGHEIVPFSKNVTWHFTQFLNFEASPTEYEQFQAYKGQLQGDLLEEISAEHRRKPLDIFFSYFWSDICDAETIEDIRRLGIKTVNWYCNASYQFHLVEKLAPAYDYSLVPEKFRLEDYRRVGANPIYCQEAANPMVYHPYDDLFKKYDVVFVGQRYGNRPGFVDYLAGAGVDTWAFGPGWQEAVSPSASAPSRPLWYSAARKAKHILQGNKPAHRANYGPALSDEDYVKMYSRAKISLGFSTTGHVPGPGEEPIKQVRLRDFEAPMSGAFYMVEYFDELTDFFEPDKEIVFFNDPDDLVDKARYYLSHDKERERIRQAGMKRALAEHTWQKRFEMAFRTMGFN